jgi:hypothetical protein
MNLLLQLIQHATSKISDEMPRRISTRDLTRNPTTALESLRHDHRMAVITYRGVPSFLVLPLDRDDMTSLLLGASAELQKDVRAAHEALDAGLVTR